MTTIVLGGIAGALLSLFFEWFPGVSKWYEGKPPVMKRAVMGVFLVLASVVVFAMACSGILDALNWNLACDVDGASKLLGLLFTALAVNQPFHAIVKKG